MPGRRLGGYPNLIQPNSIEAGTFELVTGRWPQNRRDLRKAAHWKLLLQLSTDDHLMWGTDCGVVYFMIHEDDLAKQDFDRVLAVAV
jgi:uncharacterized protein YwqG